MTAARPAHGPLRAFFVDNIGLKATSLAVAMMLFWLVRGAEDAQRAVYVDVVAVLPPPAAARMLTSELPAKVRLTLRGSRGLLNSIRSDEIPPAQVDLSEPGASIYYFEPERFEIPAGVEITEIAPETIALAWAEVGSRTLPIHARVTATLLPGLMLVGDPVVRPGSIGAHGALPDLMILESIRTEPVDLAGLPAGRHERRVELERPGGHVELDPVDAIIVSVEIAPEIVERSIPRQSVEIIAGTPPGPAVRELRPNRVRVDLRGPPETLDAIDALAIVPYVEASGLDPAGGPQEVMVRVRGIPEGVELVRVDPETVLATPAVPVPAHH